MLRTVRRNIAIILIMSMISQLCLGVTPLRAEDAGDLMAESECVPLLKNIKEADLTAGRGGEPAQSPAEESDEELTDGLAEGSDEEPAENAGEVPEGETIEDSAQEPEEEPAEGPAQEPREDSGEDTGKVQEEKPHDENAEPGKSLRFYLHIGRSNN